MFSHRQLSVTIRNDWNNVRGFLPAKTSTSVAYEAGARKAKAWDYGKGKVIIDLPPEDGWYVPDGNDFGIPNGRKSSADDPDALYLVRFKRYAFSGRVSRGELFDDGGRVVGLCAIEDWSFDSGVALIDPKALVQRAQQLETAAKEVTACLGEWLSQEEYNYLIKPTLDEAAFLREWAGKIRAIQPKE